MKWISSAVIYILLSFAPQIDAGCPWWRFWDRKYVTIKQGTLCGSKLRSYEGKTFYSFKSIPFAEPPVGVLRFAAPIPAGKWKGVLDATVEPPLCTQFRAVVNVVMGVEDCLYLNVFTHQIGVPKNGTGKDVIVWVYAGNFYFGSSRTSLYNPKLLMNKDIVLVTFNHRLGPLGFLSTEDDEAPGNYGMKDQVQVLRWVKENIAEFGGNPDSVTLGGYSSGAASVHFHLLSPLSAGLFHRAISMDGTAITPFSWAYNPREKAEQQASVLRCPTKPTSSLVSCLRELDVQTLVGTLPQLFVWWTAPSPGYTPVKEYRTERNPEPFLTANPFDVMKSGNFNRVPWILGSASQPGLLFSAPIMSSNILRNQLNEYWSEILPRALRIDFYTPESNVTSLLTTLLDHYLGKKSPRALNDETFKGYTELISDEFFLFPVHKSAQLHSLAGHKPIYLYNLGYRGVFSITESISLKNFGVSHGDPWLFVFPIVNILPRSHPDVEFRNFFITMFTSFAKYGNPTPPEKTGNYLVDELDWLPLDLSLENMHTRYLNIGQVITWPHLPSYLDMGLGPVKLNMARDLYKDRMAFWDSLPIYQNCHDNCT